MRYSVCPMGDSYKPRCAEGKTGRFYFFWGKEVYHWFRLLVRVKAAVFYPFLLQTGMGGLAVVQRARVQRGESATARCASTGNRPAALFSSHRIRRGMSRLYFIARIEQPLLYRGASASTETVPAFSPSTLLRARVSGAQDQFGCLSVSRPFSIVFRGVAKAALDCAHRTRAFLGRAFCEQRGHLAASFTSFQARSFSLQGWSLIDLPLRASFHSITLFSRVAWLILDCARRTSTFLSCPFREQEDDQAARPLLCSASTGPTWVPVGIFSMERRFLRGGQGHAIWWLRRSCRRV
jgi:hypothetical protein